MKEHLILNRHSTHIFIALIIGSIILIITWVSNKLLQKFIIKFGHHHNLEKTLITASQRLTHVMIYGLGITLFLENFHVQMSSLLGTLGVIAIGIGFALQKFLANLTSGMLLLFYKPYFIGDYIISDRPKFEGEIISINLRMTTLTHKGNLILIPNHTLYVSIITIKKEEQHK